MTQERGNAASRAIQCVKTVSRRNAPFAKYSIKQSIRRIHTDSCPRRTKTSTKNRVSCSKIERRAAVQTVDKRRFIGSTSRRPTIGAPHEYSLRYGDGRAWQKFEHRHRQCAFSPAYCESDVVETTTEEQRRGAGKSQKSPKISRMLSLQSRLRRRRPTDGRLRAIFARMYSGATSHCRPTTKHRRPALKLFHRLSTRSRSDDRPTDPPPLPRITPTHLRRRRFRANKRTRRWLLLLLLYEWRTSRKYGMLSCEQQPVGVRHSPVYSTIINRTDVQTDGDGVLLALHTRARTHAHTYKILRLARM